MLMNYNSQMSKQKRQYSFTRIRPSSQSRMRTNEEASQQLEEDGLIYSNLFHNYERVRRNDDCAPRLTVSQVCNRGNKTVKTYEIGIKQLQPRLPFQQNYFTQRNGLQPQNKKQSNYSLYLEKSLSRRSRMGKLQSQKKEKTRAELAKNQLIAPCKVSVIKIQVRSHESRHNMKELMNSVRITQKKHSEKLEAEQDAMRRSKRTQEMIEPWLMKNYQSIVL